LSRRRFLETTGVALLAAHQGLAQERPKEKASGAGADAAPRILNLELPTAAPLDRMKEFYHRKLGLKVVAEKSERLTLAAGLTHVTFIPAGAGDSQPFYHFAFNIPENKIVAALDWQKSRSPIIPVPESLRDADHPAEVVNYRHWNAHSVFFFDPAQNVVEYIARHDLKNAKPGPFDSRDILYASEIAFIVDDVPTTASALGKAAGMDLYGRGGEFFTALGDERGLLLVMKRGRLLSLASSLKKEAGVYRTSAVIRGPHPKRHVIPGFPYHVTIET